MVTLLAEAGKQIKMGWMTIKFLVTILAEEGKQT